MQIFFSYTRLLHSVALVVFSEYYKLWSSFIHNSQDSSFMCLRSLYVLVSQTPWACRSMYFHYPFLKHPQSRSLYSHYIFPKFLPSVDPCFFITVFQTPLPTHMHACMRTRAHTHILSLSLSLSHRAISINPFVHSMDPCVTKTVRCGTNHKYINVHTF
jgi:hypothetical protein